MDPFASIMHKLQTARQEASVETEAMMRDYSHLISFLADPTKQNQRRTVRYLRKQSLQRRGASTWRSAAD